MSTKREHDGGDELPALPGHVSRDLAALRTETLPSGLELRVSMALDRRPTPQATDERAGRSRLVVGLLTTCGALAVALALVVVRPDSVVHEQAQELVALTLPTDGAAGWLHLPWALHDAEVHEGALHVDLPTALATNTTEALSHAPSLTSCDHDSCEHAWDARTDAADPLRVRIDTPGRYEVNVRHVSKGRETRRQYVVVATRD